jgi:rhodanese-related sulfurtransferase
MIIMSKHPDLQDLTAPEAYEMLQSDPSAILVDIRSFMEFQYVGHPLGSVHIPWLDEPDWTVNEDFVTDIRQLTLGGVCEAAGKAVPIILICRSGKRTVEAGNTLLEAGITNVFHVVDGFEGDLDQNHQRGNINGWRHHGLPWRQS